MQGGRQAAPGRRAVFIWTVAGGAGSFCDFRMGPMNDEQSSVDLDAPATPRPDDAQSRRNYTLGVISGGLGGLMFSFLHPEVF